MTEPSGPDATGRRPDRAALAIAILLVVVAAVVAYDAFTIRAGVASYSRVGPAVFPYAVAGCLALLGLATAIHAFRHPAPPREALALTPAAWIVGGLIGQIALLSVAGFSIATGVVFAATAAAFGKTRIWITYPIGVAFTLAVWLVFAMVLRLVLPSGPLEKFAQGAISSLIASIGGG